MCDCPVGVRWWPREVRRLPACAGRTFFLLFFLVLRPPPPCPLTTGDAVSGWRESTSCRLPHTRSTPPVVHPTLLVISLDPCRPNTPPYTIQHNRDPECILYILLWYYMLYKNRQLQPASRRYKSYCRCRPTITVRFSRSWFLHMCIVFIYIFALCVIPR